MNIGQKNLGFAPQVYETESRTQDEAKTDIDALRAELRSEVRALRSMVRAPKPKPYENELSSEIAALRAAIDELSAGSDAKKDKVSQWIKAAGIEGAAAARITTLAKKIEGETPEKIKGALEKLITCQPWDEAPLARIVTIVGPSGVGKTTTVAKMAAAARIGGKSVALVGCDGFRVGAIDQLQRYAELLGASFHVASTPDELRKLLASLTEDIVFVDTSGRPPTSSSPESIMPEIANSETLLCVAASTRAADCLRVVQTFASLSPTRGIITKTDETETPAALVHLPYAMKKPIATLCTGPRVPEDIEPATLGDIFSQLDKQQEKSR